MREKVYTIEEIRMIARPIARKYNIAALYLFGSYARGDAGSYSDIDFRVDRTGLTNYLDLGALYCDLQDSFSKKIDLFTTQMLTPSLLNKIKAEEVLIYMQD